MRNPNHVAHQARKVRTRAHLSICCPARKARNKGYQVSRLNEANAFTGGNYTYWNAFACLTECSDDTASSRSSSSSLSYSFLPSPPSFCSSASRIQPPSVPETDNDSSTSSQSTQTGFHDIQRSENRRACNEQDEGRCDGKGLMNN